MATVVNLRTARKRRDRAAHGRTLAERTAAAADAARLGSVLDGAKRDS